MKRGLAVAVVLVLAAGIGMVVKNQKAEVARPGASPVPMDADGYAGEEPMLAPTFAPGLEPSSEYRSPQKSSVHLQAGFGEAIGGADFAQADDGGNTLAAIGSQEDSLGAGPRVVKTAAITLQLEEGEFEGSYQEASLVATRHAGYIQSSSVSKGDEFRSGTLIIRVPATAFDRALADFRKLGEVIGEEASGEDVSAQFVDLQARLRNWEAQETVLLRLMSEANTIDESIKVQRNLQDVQLNIERLRGQLRLLRDQTDLGTIQLTLAEGDAIAEVKKEKEEGTLVKAWRDAVGGFLAVIAATVVGLGYLIPIMLLALIAFGLFRRLRPVTVPAES